MKPPPTGCLPVNSASACAALSSSNGLRPDDGLPNSSIAIASSCGRGGDEVSSILGAREVPVMSTSMVVPCTVVVAAKSSSGSMVVASDQRDVAAREVEAMAEQVEVAAPQGEVAQHRGRGGIAGHGELAADLGIEAAAAHEHRLRRLRR